MPAVPTASMDIAIQHPWFKRALGPFYPSRLFDQFFGEGLFEYDLLPFLSSTISPYYRQSLFRTVLDSGISEVRAGAPRLSPPSLRGGVREGAAWARRCLFLPSAHDPYVVCNEPTTSWKPQEQPHQGKFDGRRGLCVQRLPLFPSGRKPGCGGCCPRSPEEGLPPEALRGLQSCRQGAPPASAQVLEARHTGR